MVFLAFVYLALFLALFPSPDNFIVSSWCDHASLLALTVSNSSLCTAALLRTDSFVFFAVHETRRIFLSPFISKASRRVSSFFLSAQLSQPYWLQATLALSQVLSSLRSVCCDFSIFSAVMPRLPALYLTWYGILWYTHHLP